MITILMWPLGVLFVYFLVGSICIKLIQLYDPSEGIKKKDDFYLCIAIWPIIFSMFLVDNAKYLWKISSNCSCFDWFFNLGNKK